MSRMAQRVENTFQAEYLKSVESSLAWNKLEHSYSTLRQLSPCPYMGRDAKTSPKGGGNTFKSKKSTNSINFMIQKSGDSSTKQKFLIKGDAIRKMVDDTFIKVDPQTVKNKMTAKVVKHDYNDMGTVPKITIKKMPKKRKRSTSSASTDSLSVRSERRVGKRRHVTSSCKRVRRRHANGFVVKPVGAVEDLRLKIEAKRTTRLRGKDYTSRGDRIQCDNYSSRTKRAQFSARSKRSLERLKIDGVCPEITLQRTRGTESSPRTIASVESSPRTLVSGQNMGASSPNVSSVRKPRVVRSSPALRPQRTMVDSPIEHQTAQNIVESSTERIRTTRNDSPLRRPLRNSPRTNTNPTTETPKSKKRKRSVKSLSPIFGEDTEKGGPPPPKKQKLSSRRQIRSKPQSQISPSSVESTALELKLHTQCTPSKKNQARSVGCPAPIREDESETRKSGRPHSAMPHRPRSSSHTKPNSPHCPSPKVDELTGSEKGSPRSVLGQLQSSSPKPFAYRMNGSPKLNGLPVVLSLNSLSSVQHSLEELTSVRQCFNPTRSVSPSTFRSSSAKSSPRPKSLLLDNNSVPSVDASPLTKLNDHDKNDNIVHKLASPEKPLCSNSPKRQKMTLAETVEMLKNRSTIVNDFESEIRSRKSPTTSEKSGRLSRRSSRSSTPNISPIKTEMLTPNSTPQITPAPSPTASPGKVVKLGRRRHLFDEGNEVLARWQDGLYYRVKILKIDEKNEKCEVQYDDNSVSWSLYKDIHRGARDGETTCCVCMGENSDAPNEIVLCDNCGQGYHQNCHQPAVDGREILDPDDEWVCRSCVFALSVKSGGAVKQGKYADQLRWLKQVLPYDVDKLTWDTQHKANVEQLYCYCGGPGIWYQKMLQCCRCHQWFHEACMQCIEQPLVFADNFYIFVCCLCNEGEEYIKRLTLAWSDLAHIALFNLTVEHNRKYFDFHEAMLPWIDDNWQLLQASEEVYMIFTDLRKVMFTDAEGGGEHHFSRYEDLEPMERYSKIEEALIKNKSRFTSGLEMRKKHALWGLRVRVPPPRTKINLPFSGKVTDSVMKTHKITGRRSKIFVCQSPLKMSPTTSPTHLSATEQGDIPPCQIPSDDQAAINGIHSPSQEPTTISSPDMLNLPDTTTFLLDRLIPAEEKSESYNSAFLTEVEQIERLFDNEQKKRFWDFFQCVPKDVPATTSSAKHNPIVLCDSPPVLHKVEPVTPSSGTSPPMPQIDTSMKRQAAKSSENAKVDAVTIDLMPSTDATTSEKECGKRRSSRKKTSTSQQQTQQSTSGRSNVPDSSLPLKKWKSVTKNYFGAFDRLCYGKGMHLVGKRNSGPGTDYLMVWDSLGFEKDEL